MPQTFPRFRLLWVLIGLFTLNSAIAEAGALKELEDTIVSLYQEKSDAVVRVKVATKSIDENGKKSTTLTVISGFFISDDGEVVTNAIPTENVGRLWIVKNGVSHIAELIGTDAHSNISLIQTLNPPRSFSHLPLDSPPAKPRIGSFAFAVTSPLDFNPSPAWGFVTGFESQFAELTFPFTYTRISIPIGPAEGGSPIFNMNGELLGISVAALPDVNSGYIVPTNSLQRILSDLKSKGHTLYGTIPVSFEEKVGKKNLSKRVHIKSIETDSQAQKAGIKAGDIFLASGDIAITTVNQLRDLIFFMKPGEFLPMTIERDGAEIEFALLIEASSTERDPLVTN